VGALPLDYPANVGHQIGRLIELLHPQTRALEVRKRVDVALGDS